ncbi:Signal transduction histidine-protein kinase ArlS [compost metagenome]
MNAAQIEKIFNRFARISSDQEGQGLGLAIAESIAVFHRIEIKVVSEINEGSSFTLLFPEVHLHN